jgi:hypothetical protein
MRPMSVSVLNRRLLSAVCCVATIGLQVTSTLTAARGARPASKTTVTTETVDGPVVKCRQWGNMQVQLKVTKTEITAGATTTNVSITIPRLQDISWPVFPNHTSRSIYINQLALPLLQVETYKLQANAAHKLQIIAGASNTTNCWKTSLQAALLRAEKPS